MGEENMDYKTLVVFLREHAKHNGDCDSCPWRDAEDRGFEVCSEEMVAKAADAIEVLIAALAASNAVIAKSKPQWIPVTERMPENGSHCLVVRFDYVTNTPFVDLLWFDNSWWDRLNSGDYAVTHWMPLPEPPEEDD